MTQDSGLIDHPYKDEQEIPPGTKTLIIGTAPPPRFSKFIEDEESFDFDFFYGSEKNYMWVILEEIIDNQIFDDEMTSDQCIAAAKKVLEEKRLWMRDILHNFERTVANSAADKHIRPKKFTDLKAALKNNISSFVFTSEQAATWTIDALEQQGLLSDISGCRDNFKSWKSRKSTTLDNDSLKDFYLSKYTVPFSIDLINDRSISLTILPTPSRRGPRGMNLHLKKTIYRQVLTASDNQ